MAYATKQKFGGQVASVGRVVLLMARSVKDKTSGCLHAGVISGISSSKDLPYIRDLRTDLRFDPWDKPYLHRDFAEDAWNFVETSTVAEVEAMPLGSWTWPVRV